MSQVLPLYKNGFPVKLRLIFFLCFTITILNAQPLHEYFFNGNLNGTNGGPTLTQNLACGAAAGAFGVQTVAVVGQTCSASNVFCFNDGGGLNYPNPSYITNQYTIHAFFKFNTLGGWSRIIDFSNSTSDAGIYLLNDCLNFFPNGVVGACPNFLPNTYYLFSFVRNGATNIITVYVNGVLFGSYNDAGNLYRPATNVTPIIFFRDDNPVPCENQPGCIRYASITSETSSPTQVLTTFTNICNIILPVELSKFSAQAQSSSVKVDWVTLSEKNVRSFEVERSTDGINFQSIESVKPKGSSQSKTEYSLFDQNPNEGDNYYRLKQIDLDGTLDYSQIVHVKYAGDSPLFYPNPAGEFIQLNLQDQSNLIRIRNILGEIVIERVVEDQISIQDLSPGTYLVELNNKVQKLIIQR